jgi:DNA-binding GntR family transcriptional regulator
MMMAFQSKPDTRSKKSKPVLDALEDHESPSVSKPQLPGRTQSRMATTPGLKKGGQAGSSTRERLQRETPRGVQQGKGLPGLGLNVPAPEQSPVTEVGPLVRLKLSHMPTAPKQFDKSQSKDTQIAQWLMNWIQKGLANERLSSRYMLPLKHELARYLGVSVGTVQNAIRQVEDDGWVESKQRVGTLLRDAKSAGNTHRVRKQTSKREQAMLAVKHFIATQAMEPGTMMPASRELATLLNATPNTIRLAMEALEGEGILESQGNRGKRSNWKVKCAPEADTEAVQIASITLIDQMERDLKRLISDDFEVNHRLPSHHELALQFNVSIKTIHDAMQRLVEQGIVHAKRGRYGTYVTRLPLHVARDMEAIERLFRPASEHQSLFYAYEQAFEALNSYIVQTHLKSGDKLPTVQELCTVFQQPAGAVRRAIQMLQEAKRLELKRGRYGGAFLI